MEPGIGMSDELTFYRGDVVLVSLPFVTDPTRSKVRPAVILQNDVGNRFSPNLIVAAISSQLPRREYPTNLKKHYSIAPRYQATTI